MNLFDNLPDWPSADQMTRRTHPETSLEAAQSLIDSGGLPRSAERALRAVAQRPRWTSAELERAEGVRDGAIRKRLSELERRGLVASCDPRPCRVGGRNALTYVATATGISIVRGTA